MAKKYKYGSDARKTLLEGVETLYKTVGATFGPCGSTVMIENLGWLPKSTKDGVSVARETDERDTFKMLGTLSLREVALKTVDRVGDGTTSAIIFAYHLLKNGLNLKYNEATNSYEKFTTLELNDMKSIGDEMVELLKKNKIDVNEDKEVLERVARTSSNGDEEIVSIIREGLTKLGKDGNFVMEESKNKETTIISSEGVFLPVGMTSQFYSTKPGKIECELLNPLIILTDQEITAWSQIKSLVDAILNTDNKKYEDRPFVVIAKDISFQAEAALVANIKRNGEVFRTCCISLAKMTHNRKDFEVNDLFIDLETVFGGTLLSPREGKNLGATSGYLAAQITDLGSCKRIIVKMDKTIIIPDEDRVEKISSHSTRVKDLMENSIDDEEKNYYGRRLSRMSDGVAIISVGGQTSQSTKEKKDRVEDAICAVQSARKNGVLPGGCTVFDALWREFEGKYPTISCDALTQALKNTVEDLYKDFSFLKLPENKFEDTKKWVGFNLKKIKNVGNSQENEVCLFEEGVLDPLFVSLETISNAIGVVGLMLNCDVLIANDNEYEEIQREIALKLASNTMRFDN